MTKNIIYESIPDNNNKYLSRQFHETLAYFDNKIYEINVNGNLEINIIKIDDKCITNILQYEDVNCKVNGNFLIKFENSNITTLNKTHTDINIKIYQNKLIQ